MLSVPDYVVPNPATRVRKLLSNIRSNNPTLLELIASVQTSTTLRNDFKQTLGTLELAIRATKITKGQKQRISAFTGGRGGGVHGGGGRGSGGNHYQKNGHTRVDAEDAEDAGYVVLQINMCNLTTKEINPKEFIG